MKANRHNKISHSRKRRRKLRRLLVFSLLLVAVCLLALLGWQVLRGIKAITTGEQPVSAPTRQTTAAVTTTTHPTITVNAKLSAPRVMIYNVTKSALLYSQGADMRCYPASLTKLLTAIIATEECTPDMEFTVGSEQSFIQQNSSLAELEKGYRLTRDMVIDAMLLPSGNDAAYCIAANIGRKLLGNPDSSDLEALFAFTDKMNLKARQLGALDSRFSNPDGYFSDDHYTTASDMLKIALAATKYENLRAAMSTPSVRHVILSGQDLTFKNTNLLLNPDSPFYFEGAIGMKTGYIEQAGHCIIAGAQRDGTEIVAVVMGAESSDDRWRDAITLLEQAFTSGHH